MHDLLVAAGFTDIASAGRPIVDEMTPEIFLDRRTGLGRDAEIPLPQPGTTAELLDRMSERLGGLSPSTLTSRQVALFFWGSKPAR